jgi:hypothetical protein
MLTTNTPQKHSEPQVKKQKQEFTDTEPRKKSRKKIKKILRENECALYI